MSSGKETPRQKMIGMMYLVLTALLALNVSKDILDAFIVVNKGLETTNANFTERNDQLYAAFDLAKSVDNVRIKPNWEKAQQIKKQSAELVKYIDDLQNQLVSETDGVEKKVADTLQMEYIESKDNYDIPTNVMIGDSEDGSKGESLILKNKLNDYRTQLTNYILPEDRKNIKVDINTDNPAHSENNENWEMYNFYNRPLVANITILSKIKNDVKTAESLVVDYLLKQVDAEALKFDTIAAKVIPQSNYVLLGEEYKADLFLAAFNKTKNPEVVVDGADPVLVENGLGKYNVKTNKEGIMTYSGTIKMKSSKNKEMVFPFKSEYIVARPALTVSADNMNVVYIGLDNPISVSVPGIPTEKLSVSVSNGKLKSNGNGKYILTLTQGPNVNVNVFATMENGERRNMGTMTFRAKRIPKPFAKIGELTESGNMSRNLLEVQRGLIAFYRDFDFKATPRVTKFIMTVMSNNIAEDFESKNNMIDANMTTRLKKLKKNDKILFQEIKAVGPDGIEVNLSPLTIKVN